MSDFSIRIAGDDLRFSASHFITFEGGACEALHGHDYWLAVEVCGPLNASQYVMDFVVLKDVVKNILHELDHRALMPQNHPRIVMHTIGSDLEVVLGGRRWVLPKDDCVLLPLANTTAEMLAQHLAGRILEGLSERKFVSLKRIRVEVGESNGFTAIYERSCQQ
jgi:6-pyruvoyltetrahydropterin/6-carboxytetrahydropterin synthase